MSAFHFCGLSRLARKLPRQGDSGKGELLAADVGPVPRQALTSRFLSSTPNPLQVDDPSKSRIIAGMGSHQSSDGHTVGVSPSETGREQRKFPRFPVELPCLYSLDNGPDWNGTVVNLSRGGCAIRGMTPVQKGDYLRILLFPSASQAPIEIGLAPVRWATNEHFGVEFITLTPRDAKRLEGYLMFMESD